MVLFKGVKETLDEKLRLARAERYTMQSVAKKALPSERVSICLRNRIRKNGEEHYEDIKVWRHQKTNKSFYSGLAVCASVWTCPVCAAKISERRRQELEIAFNAHKENGGHIAMLTLTFAHSFMDDLADILDKFSLATNKMFTGKLYNNIRKDMGIIGRIRVFEITYGDNGFHPHLHIGIFYNNDIDLVEMRKRMFIQWEKACLKFGLVTSFEHGLKLDYAENAQSYLSKHGNWSLEQELSKSHIKKAKKDSLTPFDFLRKYIETEDSRFLFLFKNYAECMKGKRQIQWSQGLKKMFIISDKSDEQLAKEKTEEADLLGMLDFETWKLILKRDLRSKLLDNIEKYGFDLGLKLTINKKESSCAEDSQENEI